MCHTVYELLNFKNKIQYVTVVLFNKTIKSEMHLAVLPYNGLVFLSGLANFTALPDCTSQAGDFVSFIQLNNKAWSLSCPWLVNA